MFSGKERDSLLALPTKTWCSQMFDELCLRNFLPMYLTFSICFQELTHLRKWWMIFGLIWIEISPLCFDTFDHYILLDKLGKINLAALMWLKIYTQCVSYSDTRSTFFWCEIWSTSGLCSWPSAFFSLNSNFKLIYSPELSVNCLLLYYRRPCTFYHVLPSGNTASPSMNPSSLVVYIVV